MSFVSSDLIGPGNTLFPDSSFPVMRKALYIQCKTTRAATAPSLSISTEAYKIKERKNEKKKTHQKTVEQAN